MIDTQKSKSQLIQELQELRQTVHEQDRMLALFRRTSRALFSSLEMHEVLPILLEEIRNWFAATSVSVWLRDIDTRELVCRGIAGPQDHIYRNWRLSPGQGVVGQVIQTGESVVVVDAQKHPGHAQRLDYKTGLLLHSLLVLPLRSQKDVFGALQVADLEQARFTDMDIRLLEPIVVMMAMVIQNARLYEQALLEASIQTNLLKEINHRVRSNLSAIVGLLYAERQREVNDHATYLVVMNELIGRIQSIATVHNMLSVSRWQPVKLCDLIRQVAQSSLRTLPRERHIPVHIASSPVKVTAEQAHSLALIVNALIFNSLKQVACADCDLHINFNIAQQQNNICLEFSEIGDDLTTEALNRSDQNAGRALVCAVVRENLGGDVIMPHEPYVPIVINFKAET